jgi:hypothetical protein
MNGPFGQAQNRGGAPSLAALRAATSPAQHENRGWLSAVAVTSGGGATLFDIVGRGTRGCDRRGLSGRRELDYLAIPPSTSLPSSNPR